MWLRVTVLRLDMPPARAAFRKQMIPQADLEWDSDLKRAPKVLEGNFGVWLSQLGKGDESRLAFERNEIGF
jgi:hypothetical protein